MPVMSLPKRKSDSSCAPVFLRGANGKVYGVIVNRTLCKRVWGSKHLLRKPPAIAIDALLYDAYRSQFDAVAVEDMETGKVYRMSAKRFDSMRWILERGYGKQYAVALRYWSCESPEEPQLRLSLSEGGGA